MDRQSKKRHFPPKSCEAPNGQRLQAAAMMTFWFVYRLK